MLVSGALHLDSETGSLTGTWDLPIILDCLSGQQPQGSICLHIPNLGLPVTLPYLAFYINLEHQTQVLMLAW